ncbi:hypothetical protein EDD16DRAFT_1709620 [Pisolithus croceorrhizus]|nr:hypothetical protein EDD16DRAFT_1709620 [Pisolithus croceorrhizus]
MVPYPMNPAAPSATSLAFQPPPPAQHPAVMQPGMEEMPRQYFGYPPPALPHHIPAPPQVDYAATLQQNFEQDHAEHRERCRRGQQRIPEAHCQAQDLQHQQLLQQQEEEERRQLHQFQLLQVQQQQWQQQNQQRQREHQLCLQQEEHQAQHQRELEQQQHLSQALNEFGRLSGEHYAQDEERCHQRTAEQNPGANDDLAFPDPPPPPPSGPPGTPPPPPPGPPGPPGPPPPPVPPNPCHLPPGGRPYAEPVQPHYLGPMSIQCPNCHALHFMAERLSNSSNARPCFGMCCLQGQVNLPPIRRWPPGLQAHFEDPRFREKICQYNAALAFTSLGVNAEPQVVQGSGPMSFHVHGALHHLIGALLPEAGGEPSYAQLYIYDPQEAIERHT